MAPLKRDRWRGEHKVKGCHTTTTSRGPIEATLSVRGITRVNFGGYGDEPVLEDYNGNGAADIAIFRESNGFWAIRGVTRGYFGSSSNSPLPADYYGGGVDNIGIFRGASGLWAVRGVTRLYFGGSSDIPVTR